VAVGNACSAILLSPSFIASLCGSAYARSRARLIGGVTGGCSCGEAVLQAGMSELYEGPTVRKMSRLYASCRNLIKCHEVRRLMASCTKASEAVQISEPNPKPRLAARPPPRPTSGPRASQHEPVYEPEHEAQYASVAPASYPRRSRVDSNDAAGVSFLDREKRGPEHGRESERDAALLRARAHRRARTRDRGRAQAPARIRVRA
jgi:hypothetical protein